MLRFNVMTVGTCRTNRKGWPKEIMNLDRTTSRGSFKIAHCQRAGLVAIQWWDNRAVNCVSSYLDYGLSSVQRQVGLEKKRFNCPAALTHYQQHMGGVDKGDQMRTHFGGFAAQSHFKKWYKKTLMAILDCMLLNAIKLWNMSCAKMTGRRELGRDEFLHVLSEELLLYKTDSLVSPSSSPAFQRARRPTPPVDRTGDKVHEVVEATGDQRCLVCQLEPSQRMSLMKKLGPEAGSPIKKCLQASCIGNRKNISRCMRCNI
jgi:hypothetical protein